MRQCAGAPRWLRTVSTLISICATVSAWMPAPLDAQTNPTTYTLETGNFWGHITYTITGARLDPPTGGNSGRIAGRSYSGKFEGSVLSVSGNARSDNESGGPGSGDIYSLRVRVLVDNDSAVYEYVAAKGERLNKSFSLSVPIPPGAKEGAVTISLLEDARYGVFGWVVGAGILAEPPKEEPAPVQEAPAPTPPPRAAPTVPSEPAPVEEDTTVATIPATASGDAGIDWTTLVGMGGLAALAAAMLAAFFRRKRESGDDSEVAPDTTIGYVLQLSQDRFALQPGESAALVVTVWAVNAQGGTTMASDASITVSAPAGIDVTPASGSGRMTAHVRATPSLLPGTWPLTVHASTGGGGSSATVSVTCNEAYTYVLQLSETSLHLQDGIATSVRARVMVTGPDPDQCEAESQRLTEQVTFVLTGARADWITRREAMQGGSMVGTIRVVVPDGASRIAGPHTATYTASVVTPSGVRSSDCALSIGLASGLDLAMDRTLRLTANDGAGSLSCMVVCDDPELPDAAALRQRAARNLKFQVSGPVAHWLHDEYGRPGTLTGVFLGDALPGMEVHPAADVPFGDMALHPPFSATITATAAVPGHGSLSRTTVVEIAPPEWSIETVVLKNTLMLDGKDAALFQVRLLPQQQDRLAFYGGEVGNQLNALLTCTARGPNADFTVVGETEGAKGYRTFSVQPTPDATELPSDVMDIDVSATLLGQAIRQVVRITVSNTPVIETSLSEARFRSAGEPLTILAEVKNPGAETWDLNATISDTGAVVRKDPTDAGLNKIAVTLVPLPLADGIPSASDTLVFTATSKGQTVEPVEVPIIVQREGLVVLTSPVEVLPDPAATKPGLLKLQVLRWNNETRKLVLDRAAMETGIRFRDFSAASYAGGEKIFATVGVSASFQWFTGSGASECATYKVRPKVAVPCDATAIDAHWTLSTSASGADADAFTSEVTVQFPPDPRLARDPKLVKEIENCRTIIALLPDDKRERWLKLLKRDAALLGYQNLYTMRHEIWEEARQLLLQEVQRYKEDADYNARIVTLIEWSQWLNDLAWQAVCSLAVTMPPPAGVAISLALDQVRAILTEYCAAAYNEGTPFSEFLSRYTAQLIAGAPEMAADLAISTVVDLDDLIEKLLKRYPTNPVKAVALACEIVWLASFAQYISYKKQPDGNPYSIPEAALEATRALRDQILVSLAIKNWQATYGTPGSAPVPSAEDAAAGKPPKPVDVPPTKTDSTTPTPADQRSGAPGTAQERRPYPPRNMDPVGSGGGDGTIQPKPAAGQGVRPNPENVRPPEEHLDRFREQPPSRSEREAGWVDGQEQGKRTVERVAELAASGDPQAIRDATLELQADKQGVYEITRQGEKTESTKRTLNRDIDTIYEKTDTGVKRTLSEKYDGADVRAKIISNKPKDPAKWSVDRDVTFERKATPGELIPHPEKPGQWVTAGDNDWVDVPARESGTVYNEEFKKAALDGASDATKEKFKDMPPDKFAKRFDQTVTDRLASDAYGRGPMDLETAVKNPAGKFSDPAGMGKTAEYKSNEWFERAERDARTPAEHETYVAEGMRQATKQYQNQVGGRLTALNATRGPGTDRPHLARIEPPPKLAQAMEIMKKVQDGTLSPSAADAQLRVMGTTRSDVAHDLGDFIKKLYTIEVPKAATPTGSQ